jgi:hypothetical protein
MGLTFLLEFDGAITVLDGLLDAHMSHLFIKPHIASGDMPNLMAQRLPSFK